MLATLLALMTMAAEPPVAPPPSAAHSATVSPVTVSPPTTQEGTKQPPADVKLDMQGSEDELNQLLSVWPAGARATGKDGRVTLRCQIDTHGLAERCDVAYEWPQGQGFGRAALKLRHTFKLSPTLGPDGPVAAVKNIQLTFKAPNMTCSGSEIVNRFIVGDPQGDRFCNIPSSLYKATEITDPVWTRAATFDDLAQAYPASAVGEGYAAARCRVRRDGGMEGCALIKEAPDGQGFGKAALHLAETRFKVDPSLAAHQHTPVLVDIPIRFPTRRELADRTVMAPAWLTNLDPKATPKLFPPEAVAQGLSTGRGVARCTVGPDGALTACVPEPGDPDGLGFSEAAAKLAGGMKMNLWSNDGAPVEGGVVHIPVRLNLKAATAN